MDILQLSAPQRRSKRTGSDITPSDTEWSARTSTLTESSVSDSNFFRPVYIGQLEQAAFAVILHNCFNELVILRHVFPLSEKDLSVSSLVHFKKLEDR